MKKTFHKLKALAMEVAETLYRFCKRVRTAVMESGPQDKDLLQTLRRDGIVMIPGVVDDETCDRLREQIDAAIENPTVNVWKDRLESDTRIHGFETLSVEANSIFNMPLVRRNLLHYLGCAQPNGFVLAAKLKAVDGNDGSGGGWHRDSPISSQFKALVYLSDVAGDNGPFEYIKKSHRKTYAIASLLRGISSPFQMRFPPGDIQRYLSTFSQVEEPYLARKGTMLLVDTKGIHRGRPILSGSRHAVTCYFWERTLPKHFGPLLQEHVDVTRI